MKSHTKWEPVLYPVSSVPKRDVKWIWPGRIPQGKLTILSGDPNLGKSFVTLDVASRVSTGRDWPDGESACAAGKVLLLTAEDDTADTIRPRLEACEADLEQVIVFKSMQQVGERLSDSQRKLSTRLISLQKDIEVMFKILERSGDYRLVVIDPISAYLDEADPNSNHDVRMLLSRLGQLAEACDVAVLLVSHLRKSMSQTPAIYQTIGSMAFTAVVRALWSIVKDRHDAERRLMVPVKMNLIRYPLGMAYRIVDPGRVDWEPKPLALEADERGENAFVATDRSDRNGQAKCWLHRVLQNGRVPSEEIKLLARENGVSRASLWDAKKALRVKAIKVGNRGSWCWELPWEMTMVHPQEPTGSLGDDLSAEELIRLANGLGGRE